jgi:nifR3 family TIM-barrel protein
MAKISSTINIGKLRLDGNLFSAPVAGYSTRAARSIAAVMGASFGFTELVSAEAIVRGLKTSGGRAEIPKQTAILLGKGPLEKHYAIQLFGASPESMYRAVKSLCLCGIKADALDLNAGCPVPKVCKTGAGSALMRDAALLGKVTGALVEAAGDFFPGIPVSVKMRSGWDNTSINYLQCAEAALEAGAKMLTLHPRTRAQVYSGVSNWEHIKNLVCHVGGGAVICGSGDLYTPKDAGRMLAETGCNAVMFARGAMGNPFIFRQTQEFLETGRYSAPTAGERIAAGFKELLLLVDDLGQTSACLEMRKIFCAYTKGIPGSARVRNELVHAATVADYQRILEGV